MGSLVQDGALSEKIAKLKAKQADKKALRERLQKSSDSQVSTVDPDARLLTKHGKTTAGYHVQIVVDGQHKLIAASDVSQDGNDTQQRVPMLEKAQEVLQSERLVGLVDVGFFSGVQLRLAEEKGLEVYVPVPKKSEAAAKEGRFSREQFDYDPQQDRYICQQGEELAPCGKLQERDGRRIQAYKSKISVCNGCPLRPKCLAENSAYKKIARWEHEAVVERHKRRMACRYRHESPQPIGGAPLRHPQAPRRDAPLLDAWPGEMSGGVCLMVLCYNFTRALNILGIDKFKDCCARQFEKRANSFGYA